MTTLSLSNRNRTPAQAADPDGPTMNSTLEDPSVAPIDPAAPAATTRRSFLTRAAVGGAVAGAGLAAAPLGLFASAAGAQGTDDVTPTSPLSAEDFAAFAVPLELAAVQAYQRGLAAPGVSGSTSTLLLSFQSHHQDVVDTLTPLLPATPDLPPPSPNRMVVDPATSAIDAAGSSDAVLVALSDLEVTIAASHLNSLSSIDDATLAKTVGQVLATESQQAAYLGRLGGTPIAELTPAEVTLVGARLDRTEGVSAVPADSAQTTTTVAGRSSTDTGASNEPAGPNGSTSNTPGAGSN